jgi:DNA-binding PadR family transcriptional regulator
MGLWVVEMLSIRFMSTVTASMFKVLILRGEARASELSEASSIKSKDVYPYMRYWILKGIVKAEKDPVANINIYSLTDQARALVNELRKFVEDIISSIRGKKSPRKVIEEAEKRYRERFGKEMGEAHRLVLSIFIGQVLNKSSPYIAIKPGEEALPQVLRTMIMQRFGKDFDAEEIIEALRELELAKIVYIDRKRFKARLDRSLL